MKVPKQHGRPGPYTLAQHQGIKFLNNSIDRREDFENQTYALQVARKHLREIKTICSEHGKFVAEFGGIRNPAILILFRHKADDMCKNLMFLLTLVFPRNHQALTFYKQVRDQHYIMSPEHPWDEQLMQRWDAMIIEIEIEMDAQVEASLAVTREECNEVSHYKQVLSRILEEDILQWSL
jgi:hypothetical protein